MTEITELPTYEWPQVLLDAVRGEVELPAKAGDQMAGNPIRKELKGFEFCFLLTLLT